MTSKDAEIYAPYHSEKTKYYGIIFTVIIAIPISIILYLSLQGPVFFSIFLSSILLTLLFILAYFSISSGNMKYEVSPQEFRVNFGLLKKKIDYGRVVSVEIVDLKLSLRLFGASLPGLHWGYFKTSIGNAHVYATKVDGKFVVVTLNDDEKIALSPEEPASFLESIKEKSTGAMPQNIREIEHQKRAFKKLVYTQF